MKMSKLVQKSSSSLCPSSVCERFFLMIHIITVLARRAELSEKRHSLENGCFVGKSGPVQIHRMLISCWCDQTNETMKSDNLQSMTHTARVKYCCCSCLNCYELISLAVSTAEHMERRDDNNFQFDYVFDTQLKQWMESQDFCCKMHAKPIKIAKWLTEFALIVHIYTEIILNSNG